MKTKLSIIVATIILISSAELYAQNEGLGVGGQLANSAGITAKYTLSETSAITAFTAFNINEFNNSFLLQVNLILNNDRNYNPESGVLRPYYGLGVNMQFIEVGDAIFGLRIPLGLEYHIGNQPVEVYTDIAPTFDVTPNAAFYFSGSLGIRIFLN